ncbi:MAG: glycosyltransferase family 39 protein [Armatimonadetes bacterium]|nr:glycosyltransferase family 39 protein [Armatimonadota bacterium]MDW8120773.1 glycosyltransferase family 39 protein [Armatimonadota bacterium]
MFKNWLKNNGLDIIVGSTIGILATTWVILTANDIGVGYDEPIYAGYALKYLGWFHYLWQSWSSGDFFSPFRFDIIERYWSARDMHPPFPKVLSAFGYAVSRHFFGEVLASMRIGTAILFGFLVFCGYWFGRSAMDRPTGLFVALALASTPRLVGDAHFLTMDLPVAATTFMATFMLPNALFSASKSSLAVASLFVGLAFSSKANGFLILPSVLIFLITEWFLNRSSIEKTVVIKQISKVFLIGTFALLFLLVTWLWLWPDPFRRFFQYFLFHFKHFGVHTFYFGRLWDFAPWHYPIVMTIVTTPIVIALMAMVGFIFVIGKWSATPVLVRLSLISFCIHIAPFLLPTTPKYNGVRLFEPAIPFFVFLSGYGFYQILQLIQMIFIRLQDVAVSTKRMFVYLLAILFVGPGLRDTIESHPFELSYYSSLIGGIKGAVNRWGFEATYWGINLINAVPFLNQQRDEKGLFLLPHSLCAYMEFYQNGGYLGKHIRIMGDPRDIPEADFLLIQASQTEWELLPNYLRRLAWTLWKEEKPVFAATYEGVVVVGIYDRETVLRVLKKTGYPYWDTGGG